MKCEYCGGVVESKDPTATGQPVKEDRVNKIEAAVQDQDDIYLAVALMKAIKLLGWYYLQFEPKDHIKNHYGDDCVHCDTKTFLRRIKEEV